MTDQPLKALALNCSLKRSGGEPSSTDKLLAEVAQALRGHGVETETLRVADHQVLPGVSSDEGDGDAWPQLRARVVATDILVLGTPIWLGQPSSVAKRVLERLDAFLGETDEAGHMPSYGKVAAVAVVGNEDGAHHVCAELFQALNDVGFTVPASASTYWVGQAMDKTDYLQLKAPHPPTAQATATLAATCAHLARLLKARPYPPLSA